MRSWDGLPCQWFLFYVRVICIVLCQSSDSVIEVECVIEVVVEQLLQLLLSVSVNE